MNISQPISSALESVEFQLLSASEVKSMSVCRIENDNTFDTLLNPVPGGLYDPALGSWGDTLCSTCNLGQSQCPGHPGHIDLPVPVYHPIFMDHAFRFIRAQCVFCHGFRVPPRIVHRFTCMFRLLQYGLLHEASMIDAITDDDAPGIDLAGVPRRQDFDLSDEDDEDSTKDNVMRARDAYVRQVLRQHRVSAGEIRKGKHEGALEMRRLLVRDFFSLIPGPRKCPRCSGFNPTYKKDRFVKIFEKGLNIKEKSANAQSGRKQ